MEGGISKDTGFAVASVVKKLSKIYFQEGKKCNSHEEGAFERPVHDFKLDSDFPELWQKDH